MDRTEFVAVVAIVLFLAFLLGWVASWVVARFSRVSQAEIGELDEMATRLHEAEEQRDQAVAYLQRRERELEGRLARADADLRAALSGLREARAEARDLRRYVEESSG